jgi:hypothetical protein
MNTPISPTFTAPAAPVCVAFAEVEDSCLVSDTWVEVARSDLKLVRLVGLERSTRERDVRSGVRGSSEGSKERENEGELHDDDCESEGFFEWWLEEGRVRKVLLSEVGRVVKGWLLMDATCTSPRYILIYTHPDQSSNLIPHILPLPVSSPNTQNKLLARFPTINSPYPHLRSPCYWPLDQTSSLKPCLRSNLPRNSLAPCASCFAYPVAERKWLRNTIGLRQLLRGLNSAVPVSRGWNGGRECDSLDKVFERGMCYIGRLIDHARGWHAPKLVGIWQRTIERQ